MAVASITSTCLADRNASNALDDTHLLMACFLINAFQQIRARSNSAFLHLRLSFCWDFLLISRLTPFWSVKSAVSRGRAQSSVSYYFSTWNGTQMPWLQMIITINKTAAASLGKNREWGGKDFWPYVRTRKYRHVCSCIFIYRGC